MNSQYQYQYQDQIALHELKARWCEKNGFTSDSAEHLAYVAQLKNKDDGSRNWTDYTYNTTLKASNRLVSLSTELNGAIGEGCDATSPEDVLRYLREIISMAESIKAVIEK